MAAALVSDVGGVKVGVSSCDDTMTSLNAQICNLLLIR